MKSIIYNFSIFQSSEIINNYTKKTLMKETLKVQKTVFLTIITYLKQVKHSLHQTNLNNENIKSKKQKGDKTEQH